MCGYLRRKKNSCVVNIIYIIMVKKKFKRTKREYLQKNCLSNEQTKL